MTRQGEQTLEISRFITVGENIHCTRIYKVGGRFVRRGEDGRYVILCKADDGTHHLPIPSVFVQSPDWKTGKIRHCSVAIWQGYNGDECGKAAGKDYLENLAKSQEAAGASYLDINVDEFSSDVEECIRAMRWTVGVVQRVTTVPVSIDSSNTDILRAGLEGCDPSRGRPMVNSVSLERVEAIDAAAEFNAVVIASAAGERELPSTAEERLKNVDALVPKLDAAGFAMEHIHVDPLVFPISVDGNNGKNFLNTVSAIREKYGDDIHIVAGTSNVSFGMPNRKLINQVFSRLAVEAGGDGGIVDPHQINIDILKSMDTRTEAFGLARALLMGKDQFGMDFIAASREGKI